MKALEGLRLLEAFRVHRQVEVGHDEAPERRGFVEAAVFALGAQVQDEGQAVGCHRLELILGRLAAEEDARFRMLRATEAVVLLFGCRDWGDEDQGQG